MLWTYLHFSAAATVIPEKDGNQQAAIIVPEVAEIQQSSASENTNAMEWTEEDVQVWLKENKLESLCTPFSETNGKDLKEMYNQYIEAPQEFKNDIKSEYKLGFASITRLIRILKELFEKQGAR